MFSKLLNHLILLVNGLLGLLLVSPSVWVLRRKLRVIKGVDTAPLFVEEVCRRMMEMDSKQLWRYEVGLDGILRKTPELEPYRGVLEKALNDAIFLAKHREKHKQANRL